MVELSSADAHQEEANFRWVLSIDGSSNQQGSGAGVILEGPNELLIEQTLWFVFKANNNQVEYEALIADMLLAKEMRAQSLLEKSDSLLVTGQVTREYQAKDPQMTAYLGYVQILKGSFAVFELMHVPREQNGRADLLAKLISSGKGGRQRTVIQETLKTPQTFTADNWVVVHQVNTTRGGAMSHRSLTQETLQTPKIGIYPVLGEEAMQVCLVEGGETWMTPYKRYLTDGILPLESAEARKIKKNSAKYTLINGELFRHGFTHPILVCVSGDQCARIMAELHEGYVGVTSVDDLYHQRPFVRDIIGQPKGKTARGMHSSISNTLPGTSAARGAHVDLQPLAISYMGDRHPGTLSFGDKADEVPRSRHRVLHEVDRG